MLTMILSRINFYITIGFLSTIPHAIPHTQVVKINYEALVHGWQNKVRMEACIDRQHQIKR
jgi:hypothetical protein